MFRLAYRNFGPYESLVVTHTVNASGLTPSTPANLRAGIRYYELRRTLPGGNFTVNEQATFAPADGLERRPAVREVGGDPTGAGEPGHVTLVIGRTAAGRERHVDAAL